MNDALTFVTRVPKRSWDGVTIPTGHLVEFAPDLYAHGETRRRMFVTVTAPDGTSEPETLMTAYLLHDGDWFLPFVRVLQPGTVVRASTRHF